MAKQYVGVDVGGSSIKMGLYDNNEDRFIKKWNITTDISNDGVNIIPDIVNSIKSVCLEHGTSISDIGGIGVGVPGPVNQEGLILRCANLGWGVFSAADEFKKIIDIDNILVGNDANVAALGEMWKGGGRGCKDVVMVTLGTGIGGGIIINGNIYAGNNGAAGEIGHMVVEPDETEACGCGKFGCLEQYASAKGIVRLAERTVKETRFNTSLVSGNMTAKDIVDAAKEGDDFAVWIVDEFARYLGMSLANVAQTLNPEVFVIGGGVSKGGKIIIDSIQKYYERYTMYAVRNTEFRLAKLGSEAGIYGCIKMVLGTE